MKKREPVVFKMLKILILVVGMIAICGIALYKVPNQDVRIKISTDKKVVWVKYSADEITGIHNLDTKDVEGLVTSDNGEAQFLIEKTKMEPEKFKSMKFYRKFHSISIKEFDKNTIWEYGSVDDQGIKLNNKGIEALYDTSQSYLLERIIYALYIVAGMILLWIAVNALKEKADPENRDNHGPIYEITTFFKNISKYREYMVYAAKADLNAEVANSYLNRLWWILEPFCNMLVYVVVFGRVMGSNIERYATFVFSALLMWNFFNHIINYSVKCIRYNRDIVTKIYVPKYVLLLTNMVLNFIKLMFSVLVLVVMLIIFKTPISWAVLWVIPAYMLMLIFSFGLGMIFLHYGVFIDDLGYAVNILLTLLMFLSGIFYDVKTTLMEPLSFIVECCNPMVVFINAMRNALLYQEVTNVPIVIAWMLISVLMSYIGIHIVNKNENGYVKVI